MNTALDARRPTLAGLPGTEPAWLRSGPLMRAGGVAVYDTSGNRYLAGLCAEAQANYSSADRQVCDVLSGDAWDWRGGVPPRQLSSAGGGPAQDAYYHSPELSSFLSEMCGGPIRPSGGRGSYSYYAEPGDHLGLHLDIVTCDVTVITVLTDSCPDDGGSLAVLRNAVGVPLSLLRRSLGLHEEVVKAPAGSMIVILGGLVPHRVLPITSTGQRVISALCFEATP
jgi:2OG-Fe(II) oxygenase superfamily